MLYAFVKAPIAPLYLRPESPCELADEALFGMVLEVLEHTLRFTPTAITRT